MTGLTIAGCCYRRFFGRSPEESNYLHCHRCDLGSRRRIQPTSLVEFAPKFCNQSTPSCFSERHAFELCRNVHLAALALEGSRELLARGSLPVEVGFDSRNTDRTSACCLDCSVTLADTCRSCMEHQVERVDDFLACLSNQGSRLHC